MSAFMKCSLPADFAGKKREGSGTTSVTGDPSKVARDFQRGWPRNPGVEVEHIIRFLRHQRARDPQDCRFSSGNPIISQPLCGWNGRTLSPVCNVIQLEARERENRQTLQGSERIRAAGRSFEGRPAPRASQGPGFRSIDCGNPGAVPATAVQTRPFPVKRPFYVPSFDNPPA